MPAAPKSVSEIDRGSLFSECNCPMSLPSLHRFGVMVPIPDGTVALLFAAPIVRYRHWAHRATVEGRRWT
jgi:hypothetical protein